MTTGIDVNANARAIIAGMERAAGEGAAMVFTPEMALLLDRNRQRAAEHVVPEDANGQLAQLRDCAARLGLWLALGSLPVRRLEDERWANRSLVIDDRGEIRARYDKIHMFDVSLASGESWRESAQYAPGERVVVVPDTPVGRLGLAVCYDIRFPALFEALGRERCDCIAIPAAFTVPTGNAHWHLLQRARAVEASAYVVAAAQVGEHEDGRHTYGHSLVVDPWGEVVLDMGANATDQPGFARIDPLRITEVRAQLPSLANRRDLPR
ncbi:carbon-nitrogen hydrolase family protein [Aurantiacibacter xanthus]|uniref:Carbon-nitrogen hydrolase family protein n=1 Tax=Aurantiacibacter xanthus TaxID=1784712 RepID=A0A3A1PAZ9_9SPHN|nr:carbon-nitrogen hydrolase family protein [Aurantiacibacter xanthus]